MPTAITKNHQSADPKTAEPVVKSVNKSTSTIEKKTLKMERILNEFPTPARQKK